MRTFLGRSCKLNIKVDLQNRNTIRCTLYVRRKLTNSQLNLPQGTKRKKSSEETKNKPECGPMPNLMVALPNIGGALCSTPQSLADY